MGGLAPFRVTNITTKSLQHSKKVGDERYISTDSNGSVFHSLIDCATDTDIIIIIIIITKRN